MYAGRQTMTISYDRVLFRYVQRAAGEGKKKEELNVLLYYKGFVDERDI